MKKVFFAMLALGALTFTSFKAAELSTKSTETVAPSGYIDFKIKNDTGSDHSIISSSGGSKSLSAQSSAHSITMKDGDDVFMYDGGKKGAKILHVDASIDGKTFNLSALMK